MNTFNKFLSLFVLLVTILICAMTYQFIKVHQRELARMHEALTSDSFKKSVRIGELERTIEQILNSGFLEWPNPEVGKSYYFLVIDSVQATAIQPEDPNTSFHILYDLENKRYVAIRNTGGGLGGRDFILEISTDKDGSRVKSFHTTTNAQAIMDRFGIKVGSTR